MYIHALRLKELLKNFAALLFMALVLLYPDISARAAKDGMHIFLYLLLPSLFPFAVIAGYLSGRLKFPKFCGVGFARLTGLSESCFAPFFLGILSGFPIGAVLTANAVKAKSLSKETAAHLLPLCSLPGPLFVVGVVGGGMLGSYKAGYLLYAVQLLSMLLTSLIFRRTAPFKSRIYPTEISKIPLVSAVEKSVSALLTVGGFIMFFQVICELLRATGVADNLFFYPPLFYGFLEISSGLTRVVLSDLSPLIKLSLVSGICAFSGICVLLQIAFAVRDVSVSLKKYFLFKCVSACISFGLAFLLFSLYPLSVFSVNANPDSFSFSFTFLLCAALLFLISALFIAFRRKYKVHTFDKR